MPPNSRQHPDHTAAIEALIRQVGDVRKVIANATPANKAAIYADLGVNLKYFLVEKRVLAESRPCVANVSVGGASLTRRQTVTRLRIR